MTFQNYLRTLATRALNSIPTAEAAGIYVISFFIDNERDDPRASSRVRSAGPCP